MYMNQKRVDAEKKKTATHSSIGQKIQMTIGDRKFRCYGEHFKRILTNVEFALHIFRVILVHLWSYSLYLTVEDLHPKKSYLSCMTIGSQCAL